MKLPGRGQLADTSPLYPHLTPNVTPVALVAALGSVILDDGIEVEEMPMQAQQAIHHAEEHLLRAEAEMARAAELLGMVPGSGDPRLAQLADVVSTHSHLIGHLATIAGSALHTTIGPGPAVPSLGRVKQVI
jgi:hypothetical protein